MKIILVGVRHKFERDVTDKTKSGKKAIFNILNKYKPKFVILEKGYFYEIGVPMQYPSKEYINSYYAVQWVTNNDAEYEFIDYDKPTDEKSLTKISFLRERYFSDYLIGKTREGKVVGFFGENHRAKMNKMLPDSTITLSIANSNFLEKFFVLNFEKIKLFIKRFHKAKK